VRNEDARPDEAKAEDASGTARPQETKASNSSPGGAATRTLVALSALALVAYLVMAMRPDAPIEITEVITAASGLLAAAGAAMRSR
jgi:hypothetical protein